MTRADWSFVTSSDLWSGMLIPRAHSPLSQPLAHLQDAAHTVLDSWQSAAGLAVALQTTAHILFTLRISCLEQ